LADDGRQGCTSRIAANSDALRIDAESSDVCENPLDCGIGVINCGRKLVLRGEAIAYLDHPTAALIGENTAKPIMSFDAAEDASATMKID
jgi:hypothetical protein